MRLGRLRRESGFVGGAALLFAVTLGAPLRAQELLADDERQAPGAMVEDETSRTITELAKRAEGLTLRERLTPDVQGALAAALRAIDSMRVAWSQRDEQGVKRYEELARAQLTLAERRYSLGVEKALFRVAKTRAESARLRMQAAEAARDAEARRRRALTPISGVPEDPESAAKATP